MIESYVVTHIIDIIALFALFVLIYKNGAKTDSRKKPFLFVIGLTVLVIIAEAGTLLTGENAFNRRLLHIVFNVIGFGLTPLIPVVFIAMFDGKIMRKYYIVLFPTVIYEITVILSPFFGWIFRVDIENHYERGNLFLFFILLYTFHIILLVLVTLKVGHDRYFPIKGKILGWSLFTIVGTGVQIFVPDAFSAWHCVTLALFLYYVIMVEYDNNVDIITDLYNRKAFEKGKTQLTGKKDFSLIVIDINNFKTINDTYGHDIGDHVLRNLAELVKEVFDEFGFCYRIGGDEFCVILKTADQKSIEDKVREVKDRIEHMENSDHPLPTMAFGYSTYKKGNELDLKKMIKEADERMYLDKQEQKRFE